MKQGRWTLIATVLAAGFLLTLGAPSASADLAQYSLTVGNSAISGYPSPYGTVGVSRTSTTTADITFTAATGFKVGDSGQGEQGIGVNVNATSWSVSDVSPNSYTIGTGSQLSSEIGYFNQTFYDNGGFPAAVYLFSFTLTAPSANWLSASDVLTVPAGANYKYPVGAHVFVCNAGCSAAVATGYAGGTAVPDSGVTLVLLGSALVGLETLRRKFGV